MEYTSTKVAGQPEILKRKLGGELTEAITLDASAFTDGVCKAGNPIAADGKVDNATAPIGILLFDVYKDNPNGTILRAFGAVNEAIANKHADITLATAAKNAMPNIVFE